MVFDFWNNHPYTFEGLCHAIELSVELPQYLEIERNPNLFVLRSSGIFQCAVDRMPDMPERSLVRVTVWHDCGNLIDLMNIMAQNEGGIDAG